MAFLLAAAITLSLLFNFSSLPFSNPSLVRVSGGVGLLDLQPFYTAQEAYLTLGQYGEKGRELYLQFLAADFIFIPLYSLGFAMLFTLAVRRRAATRPQWMLLNLLPFLIGAFDSVEDLCILAMLRAYPEFHPWVGTLSGLATAGKHATTVVSLLCLAYLGAAWLSERNPKLGKAMQR